MTVGLTPRRRRGRDGGQTTTAGPPASPARRPPAGSQTLYPHVLGLFTPLVVEPLVGAPYLTLANWLRDWFGWSEEDRLAWQQARLDAVLAHVRRHVPFYRRLLGPRPLHSVELSDLPVVDKARIRAAGEEFFSEGWRGMPYVEKATGGTTGNPWRYPLDRHAWTQIYAANIHLWERAGYRYGERVVRLGVPAALGLERDGLKGRLRTLLERHDVSQTGFDIGPVVSSRRATEVGRHAAALWYGYPSTITAMADAVLERGLTVQAPRAIVTTAEMLEPSWRRRMEDAFGSRVYDQYGCNDGGVLSQTCHRGRYHLAQNVSIVEVLDGERPCPPGVEGDVTVTNLHARVLPFLRYQVGDRAALGEGTCPCGTPGPTLERVAGRKGDRVRLPDGRRLSMVAFVSVFHRVAEVRRWQVVQVAPAVLKVRYEAPPTFDARQLEHYLRQLCGPGVTLVLAPSEPIARSPQGKHRVVVVEDDGAL